MSPAAIFGVVLVALLIAGGVYLVRKIRREESQR